MGAALCSISANIDTIVDLLPSSVDGGEQRKRELDQLIMQVREKCEHNGARVNTIHLADLEQIPLAYHPGGHKHRVQLTAIGDIDLCKFKQDKQEKHAQRFDAKTNKEVLATIKPPIQIDFAKKRPIFDENGFWCIDPIDIEYIAYGTGILGNPVLSIIFLFKIYTYPYFR